MNTEAAYNSALDYLYSFVDYSLKHASELAKAEFNLDRMRDLMHLLGDPQETYPVIHIAGTKGKGSVAALCASALHAAGYRVGLYTSPHLQDFAERMQVDGAPIPHAGLAALVDEIKSDVAQVPYITTFELTTALAFLHFARQNVDAAVLEVGLGGRLDATNIVTPRVSVITSLSLDHTAVLGDTLTDISGEKAGIIKPGRPVVSAPQDDEALVVLERIAAERRAPLILVGRDLAFTSLDHSLDGQHVRVSTPGDEPVILGIPLLGSHQAENAAVAYAALQVFQREGLLLETAHIQKGFAQAKWPGRFEVVRSNPPLVLDSAHNRYSAGKLRQTLDEYFPGWPVILIFGASEDKNVADMLTELAPRLERVVLTQAEHPRALEPEKLLLLAEQAGVEAEAVMPVEAAVVRALELAGQRALVLSAGSIFVTAAVRAVLNKK